MSSSPTQSTEVPEEAIDKAGEALCESLPPGLELKGGTWIEDPLADEWGEWAAAALQAAAPALLKQGAEEERERIVTSLLARDLLTIEIEEAIRGPLNNQEGEATAAEDNEGWPAAAYVSKDRNGARMAVGLVEPTEVPDGIEVRRYLPARASVTKRELEKRLEKKKRECEEARDMYRGVSNADSEAYWQGKGHGLASALAALTDNQESS